MAHLGVPFLDDPSVFGMCELEVLLQPPEDKVYCLAILHEVVCRQTMLNRLEGEDPLISQSSHLLNDA